MKKIAVLGAGSWGTALAMVLQSNGHQVTLWSRNPEQVDEINETNRNQAYLKDVTLSKDILATASLEDALDQAAALLFAVPSQAVRSLAEAVKALLPESCKLIIHASKGLEQGSNKRLSTVLDEVFESSRPIVVLSGPSHAEEVALGEFTAVTVASESKEAGLKAQALFMNPDFRVYTNDDVVGVEIGGALKNIYALAAGAMDGLGMGDNAKAALITRALAEMTRLGVALGAKALTFQGLSGLGDLVVTTTSPHSRNWQAGQLYANGLSSEQVLDRMEMVVEGIVTTRTAHELAKKEKVEMPIARAVYAVIYEGRSPQTVQETLKRREGKSEIIEG